MIKLLQGDSLEVLKTLEDNSVDSLVTDPPAGISFMGKDWDDDKGGRDAWIKWMSEVMGECLRVLKPGAHGLVWALPRTSHWTATALEDAGFEVRDVVTHLFGTGFPKSHSVSKAIDKEVGAEREVVGTYKITGHGNSNVAHGAQNRTKFEFAKYSDEPVSEEAKQWAGWGTALKPASEHWILVRKPCSEKTVAKNVLKYGTGGINIDASRIGNGEDRTSGGIRKVAHENNPDTFQTGMDQKERPIGGRFPANLVLDEEAAALLDLQSGMLKNGGNNYCGPTGDSIFGNTQVVAQTRFAGDTGGASRFFYCAKASSAEKNAGLEGMPLSPPHPHRTQKTEQDRNGGPRQNSHPTVKPQKLMQYLIRMITPPGGIVLDCFMGSGSTGLAAKSLGFSFIGIEREQEYLKIAEGRLGAA